MAARLPSPVAGLAGALSLLVLLPAAGPAQLASAAAVPVVERFDRLTNGYQTVVLLPLRPEAGQALQRALLREGYDPGPVTGFVDVRTRGALRQLQIDNGLRITGLPDVDTVRLLGLPVRAATVEEALAADAAAWPPSTRGIVVIGPDRVVLPPDAGVPAPGAGVPPAPVPPPHPTPGVDPVGPRQPSRMEQPAAGKDSPVPADEAPPADEPALPGDPAGGAAAAPDTAGFAPPP